MEQLSQTVRYNENKLRYDLLEPNAIEELVRVFTVGAKKYAEHNWLKTGMSYSKMLASAKRHIASFEMGEDFDRETACHHMAHAAWNLLGIVSYMRLMPEELDDRIIKQIKNK